jgi:hypothetical protein
LLGKFGFDVASPHNSLTFEHTLTLDGDGRTGASGMATVSFPEVAQADTSMTQLRDPEPLSFPVDQGTTTTTGNGFTDNIVVAGTDKASGAAVHEDGSAANGRAASLTPTVEQQSRSGATTAPLPERAPLSAGYDSDDMGSWVTFFVEVRAFVRSCARATRWERDGPGTRCMSL